MIKYASSKFSTLGLKTVWAQDMDEYKASDALLKTLPSSKHIWADGNRQAIKGDEAAIFANREISIGTLL